MEGVQETGPLGLTPPTEAKQLLSMLHTLDAVCGAGMGAAGVDRGIGVGAAEEAVGSNVNESVGGESGGVVGSATAELGWGSIGSCRAVLSAVKNALVVASADSESVLSGSPESLPATVRFLLAPSSPHAWSTSSHTSRSGSSACHDDKMAGNAISKQTTMVRKSDAPAAAADGKSHAAGTAAGTVVGNGGGSPQDGDATGSAFFDLCLAELRLEFGNYL